MRSKFKWILTLLVAFTMQFSFAQEKTITGSVTDASGNAVAGANIQVQGGARKTQTGFDGKYSIKANTGDVLVISFVGMQELRRTVGAASSINVKMSSGEKLTEIVITNFGVFKKDANKVTAAVSVVSGEEFAKQAPSLNPLNGLQGRAAGVQVTASNGQPGSLGLVTIRGAVSIGAPTAGVANANNASALYVVDGAYMREEEFRAISNSDIENMTVLKDGASAAVYGVRGGNGVIVVSTKKGSNSKPKFELSSSYGEAKFLKDPVKLMSGTQKLEYERQLNDGPGSTATAAELGVLRATENNWNNDLFRTANIQNISFSVRGGTDKVSNYFSIGMLRNTGNLTNIVGYKRLTGTYNSEYKATDKLTIGFNVRGAYDRNTLPRDRYNSQNPVFGSYQYNGYETIYERDALGNNVIGANGLPNFNFTTQGFNSYEGVLKNTEEERFFNGYLRPYITYKIAKGLELNSQLSLNYERRQRETFLQPGSILDGYVGNPSSPGSKTDNGHDRLETQVNNRLNYKFNVAENNHFDVFAIQEFQAANFRAYNNTRTGFVGVYETAGTTPTAAGSARTEATQYGYLGGFDYDFKNKYLLQATYRRDYSSLLGKTERFKDARGGSIGWVVSNENFFANKVVNFLKLRASYGELNNTLGVNRYANIANFGTTNYAGAIATTFLGQNAGSPEIGFEQAEKIDYGIDVKLFNSRLLLTSSYFKNVNKDFIFNGFAPNNSLSTLVNAGRYTVTGYELELKATAIKNTNTNLSFYANAASINRRINSLYDGADLFRGAFNILREGELPDAFYLVKYAGVDKANGDALYYDLTGATTNVYLASNRQISDKSPYAKYEGGFGMEFEYKGFELGTDFTFKNGNYIYNLRYSDLVSDGGNILANQAVDAFDYWTPTNTNASLPAPFQKNGIDSNQTSDRFLEDGSYVRFRNLNLGYSFKRSTFKNMPLEKVRLYTQIQNLYTWSKFKGDPEVGIGNLEGTSVIPGAFQGYTYPNVKTIIFGLTINF